MILSVKREILDKGGYHNKTYKQIILKTMTLLKIFAIPSAKHRIMHTTPVLFAVKLVCNSDSSKHLQSLKPLATVYK